MLKSLQKFLITILLVSGLLYVGYQLFLYHRAQSLFPPQTTIAGIDVSRLTNSDAADLVREKYFTPLVIYHRQERVEVNPEDIGFQLDIENMIAAATEQSAQEDYWMGFVEFLFSRSLEPVTVDLIATHDRQLVTDRLNFIAELLDKPPTSPLLTAGATVDEGTAGYITDVEASLPTVEAALYQMEDREAHLVVEELEAPERNIELLRDMLNRQFDRFDGIGAVFIMDLQTGEELSINGDVAISGLSILKIPIFIETYRVLNGEPDDFVRGLLRDTAVASSNFGANLLLHVIAGQDNTYLGAEMLTESMQNMGFVNTFLAVPYDAPEVSTRPSTYATPANTNLTVFTSPDPARQTTAEDIGTLLAMLYYCAEGTGGLLAIDPVGFIQQDCQEIIELMVQNTEGNLIRLGVPEDVPVSHKHGWDGITYGDAGIVFSPGGDYVIVTYVTDPATGWLPSYTSFPILWQLSQVTYNYFNYTDPYLEDPQARADKIAAELEAAEAAATITDTLPITPTVNSP